MVYSIVDRAYNVAICHSVYQVSQQVKGFFLEGGGKATEKAIRSLFSENPLRTIFVYGTEEKSTNLGNWDLKVDRYV